MMKALWIGIFTLLAVAPFGSTWGQTITTAPALEKSSAVSEPNRSLTRTAPSNTAMQAEAPPNEKPGTAVSQAQKVVSSSISSDRGTAMPKAHVPQTTNSEATTSNNDTATGDSALTVIYKVGVGDVLDIRLLNSPALRSTLYSVIEGGFIDFSIAGGPILVAGLTTKDVQARITSELKRLGVEGSAQVVVGVRQYASHAVIVTGLVGSPGTKFLRREAVPLYVLLAEVQPRLDAARATVMRAGSPTHIVDLSDSAALNFIVTPGDVINLTSRPQEFYYIGGRIGYPGQKGFQPGITLFQAILAAGGLAKDTAIELSRESPDGRLTTTKFDVKAIKSGKIKDPKLAPGDRIEVIR